MITPWTEEKRANIRKSLDEQAKKAALELGADGVVIIALYREGEYLHTQDGAFNSPPLMTIYQVMIQAHMGPENVKH